MSLQTRGIALLVGVLAAACGGSDDEEGEPFLSGSVAGDYDGEEFTATFGFATIYQDTPIVGVSDGAFHCGSEGATDPPPGHSAVFSIDAFEVGVYSSFVQIFTNVDGFEGVGASDGSVELTEVSAGAIAGTVEWSYTDDDDRHFGLSGSFEVLRCAD